MDNTLSSLTLALTNDYHRQSLIIILPNSKEFHENMSHARLIWTRTDGLLEVNNAFYYVQIRPVVHAQLSDHPPVYLCRGTDERYAIPIQSFAGTLQQLSRLLCVELPPPVSSIIIGVEEFLKQHLEANHVVYTTIATKNHYRIYHVDNWNCFITPFDVGDANHRAWTADDAYFTATSSKYAHWRSGTVSRPSPVETLGMYLWKVGASDDALGIVLLPNGLRLVNHASSEATFEAAEVKIAYCLTPQFGISSLADLLPA